MKTLFALMLLPLCALAGNDGPHGSPAPGPMPMPQPPRPQPSVMAEMMNACGFMCPQGDVNGVRIYTDGRVEQYKVKKNLPMPEQRFDVAQLDQAVAAKLAAEIAAMEITDLVDEDQGKPECQDAGTATYLVYQRGKPEKIAQSLGCHMHVMQNGNGADLQRLLLSLDELQH